MVVVNVDVCDIMIILVGEFDLKVFVLGGKVVGELGIVGVVVVVVNVVFYVMGICVCDFLIMLDKLI